MATFWEIAASSVSNLFSLYFVYLLYLFISRFGFKSGICLLIAPVPVHCFPITFAKTYIVGTRYEVILTCTYNLYFGLKEEKLSSFFIRKLSFSQPLKSHCTSLLAKILE